MKVKKIVYDDIKLRLGDIFKHKDLTYILIESHQYGNLSIVLKNVNNEKHYFKFYSLEEAENQIQIDMNYGLLTYIGNINDMVNQNG